MSCARTQRSAGPLRWTWRSTCSTACWSWDARSTSASPDPGRGRGQCARTHDPCTTLPVPAEAVCEPVEVDVAHIRPPSLEARRTGHERTHPVVDQPARRVDHSGVGRSHCRTSLQATDLELKSIDLDPLIKVGPDVGAVRHEMANGLD